MECKECFKILNEMTLFCDRCGAQVQKEKQSFNYNAVESMVVKAEYEQLNELNFGSNIRNSYFLSSIQEKYKGSSKKYITQYIDYTFLKIFYDSNKRYMMTDGFSSQTALIVYEAFSKRKFNKKVYALLELEYGENFTKKVLPDSVVKRVGKVYIPSFDLSLIKSSRLFMNTLTTFLFQLLKTMVIVGLLFFISTEIENQILDIPFIFVAVASFAIIIGSYKGKTRTKYQPFREIVKKDYLFKMHINKEIKSKYKTLKYRVKKGGLK